VQPTSRRLVNLTYVALCLFVSNLLLLSFYVVDKLGDIVLHKHLAAQTIRSSGSGSSVPSTYPYNGPVKPITVVTLSYLSRYGLAVFLVANVLTGCVNTTMRTIYATTPVALLVLTVYSLAVTGLAWNGRAMYVCGPKFVSLVRRCVFRNCES
jgi:phosphatidylinositol glycan class W